MMICPDCGKSVGRFSSKQDEGTSNFKTITCPRTGRKVLPEFAPEKLPLPGRKAWRRKKSQREVLTVVLNG